MGYGDYYENIDIKSILSELSRKHQIKITDEGTEIDFYFCPGCTDHQIDFNIDKATFKCHRCGSVGTFKDIYDALEGDNAFFNKYKRNYVKTQLNLETLNNALNQNLLQSKNQAEFARRYLNNRCIDDDTIFYQKIGLADEKFLINDGKKHYHLKNCITWPVYDKNKNIVNIRFKQVQNITPNQYYQGKIFNLDGYGTLQTNYIFIPELQSPNKIPTKRTWIFEGEPDAILAWQILKNYANPNFYYSTKIITGTAGANSIPKEWTKDFFDTPTTVFYDKDRAGETASHNINQISENIRIANLEHILDNEEDKDITDLAKNIGEKRTLKSLVLLEMLAININKNAEFTQELNKFKSDIGKYIMNINI